MVKDNTTSTSNTSRTPILDQVLAIRNLLALNDHELEELINLQQERDEAAGLAPSLTEVDEQLLTTYDQDIQSTVSQYHDHYLLRKELQSALFRAYSVDLKYRCQFKHKLTIQEALKEIADATNDQDDWYRFNQFTTSLYLWIGRIT